MSSNREVAGSVGIVVHWKRKLIIKGCKYSSVVTITNGVSLALLAFGFTHRWRAVRPCVRYRCTQVLHDIVLVVKTTRLSTKPVL